MIWMSIIMMMTNGSDLSDQNHVINMQRDISSDDQSIKVIQNTYSYVN